MVLERELLVDQFDNLFSHLLPDHRPKKSRELPVKKVFDRRLQEPLPSGAEMFLTWRRRDHGRLLCFRSRTRLFLRNSSTSRRRWGAPWILAFICRNSRAKGVESFTIRATALRSNPEANNAAHRLNLST